jgi:hypothetical protein
MWMSRKRCSMCTGVHLACNVALVGEAVLLREPGTRRAHQKAGPPGPVEYANGG